ncbi:putative alanine and arginine rich protein [Mycobacterium lentiflavum]|uniref:Putative alanine and arginine rich protein n=1 Tax=Mycobacterium lentiflavum TaxID=141349 RepID=A0A0E4GWY8_MYCLN|nr:DEAD/DEAH box helicase [Mycobacterium lentiflavum]CQD10588.1 putative alanine and arginine rich protein [Mycobacterium lentiflavum]
MQPVSAASVGIETRPLRGWQRRALVKYVADSPRDFLAVATPGSGKTTFALRVISELLSSRAVEQITVVVPTEHLKVQWAQAALRYGIFLDPRFSNSSAATSPEYHGVMVTYAQVASHPTLHRVRTEQRKTLVVFDEIHHGGDAKTWGDAIREAFSDATRRLALTGTPFRSDDSPIPFVTYESGADGIRRSQADHTYGYAEALADGVVRPVVFLAYSGQARWRDNAGEEHEARLGEPLSAEQTARAWRTALDPAGEWMPAVITAADQRLRQLRTQVPDAGGMIIASDQTAARAYATLLTRLTGEVPTLVLSDDPGSSQRISEFAESTSRWLVAVRMVSEGVDVPRLSVGIYATSASTPLFFAQAIGRFVRSRRPGETASIFVPSVPNLLMLASELEAERNHVLGEPHRESLDDPLLADPAVAEQNEKTDLEKGFTSLGADAELDQVIFDGSSFGTAAAAGSDEEADYLGIPGLLDATQMRALLHRRQDEQLQKRAHRQKQAGQPAPAPSGPGPMHGQLRELRRELNSLVSVAHHRTGKPHGWIHNELRRRCGGPPIAAATRDQLKDRIVALRQLNSELA